MSRYKIFAAALMLLPLVGCEHIASIDRHTFKSTPHQPTTITLVDTTNSQEFWKMDVPVCTRLRMDFDRPPEWEGIHNNLNPASILNWQLLALDGNDVIDEGTCYLSGCRPFLMKVAYRDSPEVPETDQGMLRDCPTCPTQGSQTAHYHNSGGSMQPSYAGHQGHAHAQQPSYATNQYAAPQGAAQGPVQVPYQQSSQYQQAPSQFQPVQETQVVSQYQPMVNNEFIEMPE